MKQAILITAYKNYGNLKELVDFFAKECYVFIHIDAKSKEILEEQILELNTVESCFAIRKYAIYWGGYSHLRAVLDLMQMASEHPDISYVHIITGEDYPVRAFEEFQRKFLRDDHIYMSVMPPEEFKDTVTVRYRYYNWFIDKNVKNPVLWQLQRATVILQKLFGVSRDSIGEFCKIYKGLLYASFPREVLNYIESYLIKHPEYLKDLKRCQLPEEFFFQTIIMNSSYARQVAKQDIRYMNWEKGDSSSPIYLTMEAYGELQKKRYFFARKFHPIISQELKEHISEQMFANRVGV